MINREPNKNFTPKIHPMLCHGYIYCICIVRCMNNGESKLRNQRAVIFLRCCQVGTYFYLMLLYELVCAHVSFNECFI